MGEISNVRFATVLEEHAGEMEVKLLSLMSYTFVGFEIKTCNWRWGGQFLDF